MDLPTALQEQEIWEGVNPSSSLFHGEREHFSLISPAHPGTGFPGPSMGYSSSGMAQTRTVLLGLSYA